MSSIDPPVNMLSRLQRSAGCSRATTSNWAPPSPFLIHVSRPSRTLTETTVAIVDHEVGSKGSGGEVVHAAGAVRHIPHHDGVGVCEPEKHKAKA